MSDVPTVELTPVVRTTKEAYGPEFYSHILEQYKMAVTRAETTAERRENGNKLFFVILTLVAVAYGVGAASSLSMLLPLLGSYICVGWLTFIWSRHQLNIATFRVIREIEQQLPARIFDAERERRYAGKAQRRQVMPVSWWELVMPLLFAMFFLLLLVEALFVSP